MTASLHLNDPLPPLSVSGRDIALRSELAKRGTTDALVVFDLNNIRWLTGFTGSAGTLIVRNDEMVLVTDGRYGEQARFQLATSGAAARVHEGRSAASLREGIEQSLASASQVAVDPNEVTQAQFDTLRTQTTAQLVPTVGVVQHLRRRKTAAEIARMRRAAACTDAALAECVEMMKHRPTERDVRDELEYRMRRHGADGPSYDTIVATGFLLLAGTLASYNLPLEGVTLILGVDAVMDMARTSVNVVGNCLASAVIARWEGKLVDLPEATTNAVVGTD